MVLNVHPIYSPVGRCVPSLHRGVSGPRPDITQSDDWNRINALSPRLFSLERALTAVGLVTAGTGLLCLLAFGVGWSPSSGFLELWLSMVVCSSPLGVWIHRAIKPLFWL
ncbi:hypothetical protein [Hydrogenophaga sp.]|uniref:hypothetical protein n=1 Tax=Hydrogenophaga sp. TaxID=1904254 RepID=UPI002FC9ED3F